MEFKITIYINSLHKPIVRLWNEHQAGKEKSRLFSTWITVDKRMVHVRSN
jgi:hypothetical protein